MVGVVSTGLRDLDSCRFRAGSAGGRGGGGRSRGLRGSSSLGELGKALLSSGPAAGHEVPVSSGIVRPDRDAPDVEDDKEHKATDEVVQAVGCQSPVSATLTICSWRHA